MRNRLRAVAVAVAAVAPLAFAGNALAANTGTLTVWHTPMALGSSTATTTIHVSVPQSTDPIAAVTLYSAAGYTANLTQAPGTKIGTVTAAAFSRDNNLTLPLDGDVVTADPSAAATVQGSTQCTGIAKSQAVWVMNLSVAGQTLAIPIYVNSTAGAPDSALGGYRLSICLPPPDVPAGTPGRAFQGAQLLEALLTLNAGVFTTPTGAGLVKWEGLFTPYTPGKGVANRAGTFEARAFVPLPIVLTLRRSYVAKTNTWKLSGNVTEGGQPVGDLTVTIRRGTSPTSLGAQSTTRTKADGSWSTAGHLKPRRTTYFQISASEPDRDFTTTGCASPATTVAPAGCVKATLARWSTKSATLKFAVVTPRKKK
ncbi:MAG TPA: hypothetical protein VFA56_14055 [Gaiellaceae bacterium]|nr:hypothetical protein [Gaiellaceae bacterium]